LIQHFFPEAKQQIFLKVALVRMQEVFTFKGKYIKVDRKTIVNQTPSCIVQQITKTNANYKLKEYRKQGGGGRPLMIKRRNMM
jgi:hypothetical protein